MYNGYEWQKLGRPNSNDRTNNSSVQQVVWAITLQKHFFLVALTNKRRLLTPITIKKAYITLDYLLDRTEHKRIVSRLVELLPSYRELRVPFQPQVTENMNTKTAGPELQQR